MYSDGEIDIALDSKHIRAFKPYEIGERIEAINDEGDYVKVEVVKLLEHDSLIVRYRDRRFTIAENGARRVY